MGQILLCKRFPATRTCVLWASEAGTLLSQHTCQVRKYMVGGAVQSGTTGYPNSSDLTAGRFTAARLPDQASSREVAETAFLTLKILRRGRFPHCNPIASVVKLRGQTGSLRGTPCSQSALPDTTGDRLYFTAEVVSLKRIRSIPPLLSSRGFLRRFR